MRTILLALSLLVAASLVWADDNTREILGGLVKSVSWADPVKGTNSQIIVKDVAGKLFYILIGPNTTVWDAEAKPIIPEKILVRNHINVIYHTTQEGINIGKSIKLLK